MGSTTKGRKWVNKNGLTKSVKPKDLSNYLSDGWSLGRVKERKYYKKQTGFICKICGYECGNGYLLNHIKLKHRITKEEYLKLYPNSKFYTEEFLNQRSLNTTKEMNIRWENTEYRNKMTKVLTDNANNEEFKQKRIESIRNSPNRFHTEEYNKNMSKRIKELWNTKDYRDKYYEGIMNSHKRFKSEQTKQKISKRIKELWEQGVYNSNTDKSFSFGRRYSYKSRCGNIYNLKSLQELRVAYFLDLCNKNFIYGAKTIQKFNYMYEDEKHIYIPDFQIKDIFIEVKPNNWECNNQVFNKIYLVQRQNNIFLFIYDDTILQDLMPKITRNNFYTKVEKLKKFNVVDYVDMFNYIGDIRSNYITEV